MNELNAEQIKKALECCASPQYKCEECPIDKQKKDDCVCGQFLAQNALALIKELTEENERLQKALNTDISIVRVSRGNGKTAHLRELGRIKVDAIRADTVQKMAVRLAVHFGTYTDKDMVKIREVFRLIDQIAKEMEEEQNERQPT